MNDHQKALSDLVKSLNDSRTFQQTATPSMFEALNTAAEALKPAPKPTGCKPGKVHNFITYSTGDGIAPDTVTAIRCQWCQTHRPDSPGYTGSADACPRCANPEPVELERADEARHIAFRCRVCGHIFGEKIDEEWVNILRYISRGKMAHDVPGFGFPGYPDSTARRLLGEIGELAIESKRPPVKLVTCLSLREGHQDIHANDDHCSEPSELQS